jgi:hypothetical protein
MKTKDETPRIPPWTPDLRFKNWRPRDPQIQDRSVTRPASKNEARERTRSRIPADHPDIPF